MYLHSVISASVMSVLDHPESKNSGNSRSLGKVAYWFILKFLRQVGPRIFPKIINCRFRASNFVDYITFEHCNVWVNVYLLIGMHQTIIKHRFPLELWPNTEDFRAEFAKIPACSTADSDFGMTKRRHGDKNAIIGSALKNCIDMVLQHFFSSFLVGEIWSC